MKNITEFKDKWQNTPDFHKEIHESFIALVNNNPELKEHRDFVEQHIFGFGERSFLWLWKLIVHDMLLQFTFMEIGVFKGQILSLIELLAKYQYKEAKRIGVTPLDNSGIGWESDYSKDIEFIHDKFGLSKDYVILKGSSVDPEIIKIAKSFKLDILYIDGSHTFEDAASDIKNYAPLIKPGGYLVIDDCACDFSMPFGFFTGIVEVTNAVFCSDIIKNEFEFICSVVHIKVWKRK